MKLTVRVVVEPDAGEAGEVTTVGVASIERDELTAATIGLCLDEAKDLLAGVQEVMVTEQAARHLASIEQCSCGRRHRHKDMRSIVCRTLFGTIRVPSPRWLRCSCNPGGTKVFTPLAAVLPARSTPELVLVETELAARMSFRAATRVLERLCPLGRHVHAAEVHRHVARVADRLDGELGHEQYCFIEPVDEPLPRPDLPLVVTVDGGYVHSATQTSRRDGWFQAIVGTVSRNDGPTVRFGYVPTVDTHRRRRLFEHLQAQGMTPNQQVTFLTDGGDDVQDLTAFMNENSEHILDWFHITMRLTVLRQLARSLPTAATDPDDDHVVAADLAGDTDRSVERVKWLLWHGNVHRARQRLNDIRFDLQAFAADSKMLRLVDDFDRYLDHNSWAIPNYGERHRHGEPISSAPAEATVNAVIAKRMVKKQQMRWSPTGAHRMLQVRCRTLNRQLANDFQRWHPRLPADDERALAAA